MPTVAQIEQALFQLAPKDLAFDWDNVGHLEGSPDQEVQRVLVALDVTENVVSEAEKLGCQLIVSHHPLMNVRWHQAEMQTLRPDRYLGRLLRRLVKTDISVISMHTKLDLSLIHICMRPEPCLERTESVHRREGKVCAENPGGVFCTISIKRFFT